MKSICNSALLMLLVLGSMARADDAKAVEKKVKEIAGVAEFLRSVPKHFGTVQSIDSGKHQVTLLIEGDKVPKTWPLMAEAEVKIHGWWGRIEQLHPGDRIWAWFQTDRQKRPIAIMMLADEMSQQDIHDTVWTLTSENEGKATVHPSKGADKTLPLATPTKLPVGTRVFWQTNGEKVTRLVAAPEFEGLRKKQQEWLKGHWVKVGLPATVTFLHQHSGEMELMLDHESMRWGRSLKPGDSVALTATPDIKGVVREMRPWRERTVLRLVVAAQDQGDLRLGQRVAVTMAAPSQSVQEAQLPPDIGRRKDKTERVEWFLASVYCTCLVRGNICTGHFYTLASCNPNGCGQPAVVRKHVARLIDEGKTDEQIFADLLKEYGSGLLKPHLLP